MLVDSVFEIGKSCYPEVFLEEFKYIVKEKKWLHILIMT